jgi:high affinity Mn2+ porin
VTIIEWKTPMPRMTCTHTRRQVGAAVVVDGLSSLHRRYLEGGGYGFMLGDGALNYGREVG